MLSSTCNPKSSPGCPSQGSQETKRTSASPGPPVSSHQSLKVVARTLPPFGVGSKPTTLSAPNSRIRTRVQSPHPAPMSMIRPHGQLTILRTSPTASKQGNDHPRLFDVQPSMPEDRTRPLPRGQNPPRRRFASLSARHTKASTSFRLGIRPLPSYRSASRSSVAIALRFN